MLGDSGHCWFTRKLSQQHHTDVAAMHGYSKPGVSFVTQSANVAFTKPGGASTAAPGTPQGCRFGGRLYPADITAEQCCPVVSISIGDDTFRPVCTVDYLPAAQVCYFHAYCSEYVAK